MHKLILLCCILALSAFSVQAETQAPGSLAHSLDTPEQGGVVNSDDSPVQKSQAKKEPGSSTSKYEPMNNWPVVVSTLLGMVFCIFVLAWFARRFNGFNVVRNKDMDVVSSLSVGAREKITLVNVRGQTLLLGVTSQQISCLHAFDVDPSATQEAVSQTPKPDFSATLKGLLNKNSTSEDKDLQTNPSKEGK